MTITTLFILIGCGVLTNLMSALFGIGGGVLMVPILHTLFPDFPLQMVAATSLTIVIGTALINLSYFYKQKIKINVKSLLIWSLGMIVGVQLGFECSFLLPDWAIIAVFVVTLVILAIRIWLRKEGTVSKQSQKSDRLQGCLISLFGGGVAGITGIGGGSIMAPLIGLLPSVEAHQIAAYTNYMMVLGGLGSLYGYLTKTPAFTLPNSYQIGYVNFSVVAVVVLSSLVASFFSMRLRGMLKPTMVRKLLGGILFVIAGYMVAIQFI